MFPRRIPGPGSKPGSDAPQGAASYIAEVEVALTFERSIWAY